MGQVKMLRGSTKVARILRPRIGSPVSNGSGFYDSPRALHRCVGAPPPCRSMDIATTPHLPFSTSAGVGASVHRLLDAKPDNVEFSRAGLTTLGRGLLDINSSFPALVRSSWMASFIGPTSNHPTEHRSVLGPSNPQNHWSQMRLSSTSTMKNDEQTNEKKSLGARIKTLLSNLEKVPVVPLGLGLAGAIPFVCLAPGIASLLPLPEGLQAIHIEAQAAYGTVILTFLGAPHWGLAMADYGVSPTSSLSRSTVQTVRYIWGVMPSLVAWPAVLLSLVPKFTLLITSYGLVLGMDAMFARVQLLPQWYMPLRVLLTSIAMLSMTSSLIVTAGTQS